ncbi:MAG: hypothetical protein PWQ67_2511 [Clostridia bacterium]|nr:hypothetical protein [Clostridia bacterium]
MGSLTGHNTKISSTKRGEVRFSGDPERMKPSEVKIYQLDPKEIQEKYGPPKITKFQLMSLLGEGKTLTEIGKMFEISGQKVNDLIRYYQIGKKERKENQGNKEERKMGPELQKAVKVLSKEQMVKYIEEGKKDREIAELSGLTETRIKQLKRFYCLTPGTKGRENEQGFNKDMLPKNKGGKEKRGKNGDSVKPAETNSDKPIKDIENVADNKEQKCSCMNTHKNILNLATAIKEGKVSNRLQQILLPKELRELYDALTIIVNNIVELNSEILQTKDLLESLKDKNIVFNFNFGNFEGGK